MTVCAVGKEEFTQTVKCTYQNQWNPVSPYFLKTTWLEGNALRYYWNYNEQEFLQFYTVYLDDVMSQKAKTRRLAVVNLQGNNGDTEI